MIILLVPCFESVHQARCQHYRLLGRDGGEGVGRSGGMWMMMPKAQCSLCGGVQVGIGPRTTLMIAGSGYGFEAAAVGAAAMAVCRDGQSTWSFVPSSV